MSRIETTNSEASSEASSEPWQRPGHAAILIAGPTASGKSALAVRLAPGDALPERDALVHLRPAAGRVHAFDADGLARPLPAAAAPAREAAATS